MIRRPTRTTSTDTRVPYTTPFRSRRQGARPAGYRRRRQARQDPRRHRAREPAQPCTRAAQGELPRQRPARGRVARWRSGAADATALGTAAGTRRRRGGGLVAVARPPRTRARKAGPPRTRRRRRLPRHTPGPEPLPRRRPPPPRTRHPAPVAPKRPARGRVARWRSGAADATSLGTAAGTRRRRGGGLVAVARHPRTGARKARPRRTGRRRRLRRLTPGPVSLARRRRRPARHRYRAQGAQVRTHPDRARPRDRSPRRSPVRPALIPWGTSEQL